MKRIGILGLGFMGAMHLRNWQATPGAEVVAVCCRSIPESGKTAGGNIGDPDAKLELEGIRHYTSASEMYAREQLDAVSITLPTHLHLSATVQALEAGMHVLCEKPMALSPEDCSQMINCSEQVGRQLMIAHCIRFWPAYHWLKMTKDSGKYGALLGGQFDRLCAMPRWSEGSLFADPSKSGGIALDLHIHDLDYMSYLCGVPMRQVSRTGSGHSANGESFVKEIHTYFEYDDDAHSVLNSTASWLMSDSFGFEMSFRAMFEEATVTFSSRNEPGRQLAVFPSEGEVFQPPLDSRDGYFHEIQHFMDLICGRTTCALISAEDARQSVELALQTLNKPTQG